MRSPFVNELEIVTDDSMGPEPKEYFMDEQSPFGIEPKNEYFEENDFEFLENEFNFADSHEANLQNEWQEIRKANDISVGSDGTLWIIGTERINNDYKIYYKSQNSSIWNQSGGSAIKIILDNNNNPWVINSNGEVYVKKQKDWIKLNINYKISEIAFSKTSTWLLFELPFLKVLMEYSSGKTIPHYVNALKFSVAENNILWVVNTSGDVMYLANNEWKKVGGISAKDIAVDGYNKVWVLSADMNGNDNWVYFLEDINSGKWYKTDGAGLKIRNGKDGKIYVINSFGKCYKYESKITFEKSTYSFIKYNLLPTPIVVVDADNKNGLAEIKESPYNFLREIVKNAGQDPHLWFDRFTNISFLGRKLNSGQYVQETFAKHLTNLEQRLVKIYGGPNNDPKLCGDKLGLSEERIIGSREKSKTAKFSYHMFGLAIDVNYKTCPYIQAHENFNKFINKVFKLVKNINIENLIFSNAPFKTAYQYLEFFDQLQYRNSVLKEYFTYINQDNRNSLQLALSKCDFSEWQNKNLEFNIGIIKRDLDDLSSAWQGSRPDPQEIFKNGFLGLTREFVKVMVESGLDWGGRYGDIMHFDMRTTQGIGQAIENSKNAFISKIKRLARNSYDSLNNVKEHYEIDKSIIETINDEINKDSFILNNTEFEYSNDDEYGNYLVAEENHSENLNKSTRDINNKYFIQNIEEILDTNQVYSDEFQDEYNELEGITEDLVKDLSKAIVDNRYYRTKLGWGQYFDQINKILLPSAGLSNVSLGDSDFALALSKWQASQGFAPNEADGVLGPHTWNKLKTQLNIKTSTGFGLPISSSVSPVSDPVISSEFSNQRKHPVTGKLVAHYGIDIVDRDRSKTLGKTVVSATDGTIASVKPKSDGNGAGNRIHIIDSAGYKHSYFHLSDNNFGTNIRSGSKVTKGQKIGEIGNTGRSSGPHLHYETVHPNGTKMNPRLINAGLRMAPNKHEVREFEYEFEYS